ERPRRLPRDARVPAMTRLARQPRIGIEVSRVRVCVIQTRRERIEQVRLACELEALAPGAADVGGGDERGHRELHAAPDQIGERGLEEGRVEANAVVPQLLPDARVPGEARLWLEVRVGEAGEEQVIEGRRPEAGAGAAVDSRARLFDQERERAALRDRLAEHVVAL